MCAWYLLLLLIQGLNKLGDKTYINGGNSETLRLGRHGEDLELWQNFIFDSKLHVIAQEKQTKTSFNNVQTNLSTSRWCPPFLNLLKQLQKGCNSYSEASLRHSVRGNHYLSPTNFRYPVRFIQGRNRTGSNCNLLHQKRSPSNCPVQLAQTKKARFSFLPTDVG